MGKTIKKSRRRKRKSVGSLRKKLNRTNRSNQRLQRGGRPPFNFQIPENKNGWDLGNGVINLIDGFGIKVGKALKMTKNIDGKNMAIYAFFDVEIHLFYMAFHNILIRLPKTAANYIITFYRLFYLFKATMIYLSVQIFLSKLTLTVIFSFFSIPFQRLAEWFYDDFVFSLLALKKSPQTIIVSKGYIFLEKIANKFSDIYITFNPLFFEDKIEYTCPTGGDGRALIKSFLNKHNGVFFISVDGVIQSINYDTTELRQPHRPVLQFVGPLFSKPIFPQQNPEEQKWLGTGEAGRITDRERRCEKFNVYGFNDIHDLFNFNGDLGTEFKRNHILHYRYNMSSLNVKKLDKYFNDPINFAKEEEEAINKNISDNNITPEQINRFKLEAKEYIERRGPKLLKGIKTTIRCENIDIKKLEDVKPEPDDLPLFFKDDDAKYIPVPPTPPPFEEEEDVCPVKEPQREPDV
jgi:hypothetical protein